MTGSTGNIYTVTICRQPVCSCPHNQKGNQCKHILYVVSRVLRDKAEYLFFLSLPLHKKLCTKSLGSFTPTSVFYR